MIVSVYDGDDDGIENRLKFWLRLDSWPVRDACWLLLDVDPDTVEYVDDNNLAHLRTLKGKLVKSFTRVDNESLEQIKLLDRYLSNYFDLVRIIGGSYQVDRNLEFEIFKVIEKALSKNIEIPWYEWAVKKGFYVPKNEPATKQEAEKPLVDKERGNLYRIIAALSETLLNENSSDKTKPHLKNQSKLIEYLDHQYDGYAGVKKSNLETVLAAAKKLLNPS